MAPPAVGGGTATAFATADAADMMEIDIIRAAERVDGNRAVAGGSNGGSSGVKLAVIAEPGGHGGGEGAVREATWESSGRSCGRSCLLAAAWERGVRLPLPPRLSPPPLPRPRCCGGVLEVRSTTRRCSGCGRWYSPWSLADQVRQTGGRVGKGSG